VRISAPSSSTQSGGSCAGPVRPRTAPSIYAKVINNIRHDFPAYQHGFWSRCKSCTLLTLEIYGVPWIPAPPYYQLAVFSLLTTRPIFLRTDAAIRGHIICTFLALVLRQELLDRPAARGGGSRNLMCMIDRSTTRDTPSGSVTPSTRSQFCLETPSRKPSWPAFICERISLMLHHRTHHKICHFCRFRHFQQI
jgi:hypothetical protein